MLYLLTVTLFFGVATVGFSATAAETDQFTLPPFQLSDVGPRLSRTLFDTLTTIEKVNPRKNDEARAIFYRKWGVGLPTNKIEDWLDSKRNLSGQELFEVKVKDSIYAQRSKNLVYGRLAPTINLFGIYLGTDKLGHFTQQGHEYFKVFELARHLGLSEGQAQVRAVALGVFEERTFFGLALTGVYSNGDLAANFAGMKFYRNFFETVKVGGESLPPFFTRVGDRLVLNRSIVPAQLLRPFIRLHMNEAFNSSRYSRASDVAHQVSLRCREWIRRGLLPQASLIEAFSTFFGEDYGYNRGPGRQADLVELCLGI